MEAGYRHLRGPPSRDQRAASHVIAPVSIIGKRARHYDAAFTMKAYVRTSDGDVGQGTKALAVST